MSLLGEELAELKEGLNTFQANAFESLYDKKVQWAKNDSSTDEQVPAEKSEETSEVSVAVKVADVVKVEPEDEIDESPVAKKKVVTAVAPVEVVVPEPVKAMEVVVKPVEVAVPVAVPVEENKITIPVVAAKVAEKVTAPVATKQVAEVKKAGGFFGFLQSDSAVQQIANKNQPTAPPAIAKAFMSPAPVPAVAPKKEARKSPEGLNMAMFKQDPEEIEAKKVMMASRPSLASAKAEAAKDEDRQIPSGAPIKAPVTPEEPAKGMFSFLTPPAEKVEAVAKAAPVEEKVAPAMAMAKKSISPPPVAPKAKDITQTQAPPMKKEKAPAQGGFFSFLTSDPSLVAPGDPNLKPTAPPAVARAFMAPTPIQALKEGEMMSAAAMRRKAEFDQDVIDEEIKSKMMAARPSISDLKTEASKTLSKQQMRDAAAAASGQVKVAKAPAPGLFDFFSQDAEPSSGDLFEPVDPNQLTAKEIKIFSPPAEKPVAVVAKKAAPAPAKAAPSAPATGGMFGFLNQGAVAPSKPDPVVTAAVAKKAVVAPAPTPVAKAPAPAGGMFGFLNSGPSPKAAPAEAKVVVATAVAKKTVAAPAPAPVPIIKAAAPAPAGGMFGFLNPGPAAPKSEPVKAVVASAVAAKKVTVAPAPTPVAKAPAPAGGMFGFLNSGPSPKAVPAEAKVAPAVATKSVPAVTAAVAKKAVVAPAPTPVAKAPAPAGGMFGFLNSGPSPKAAPAEAKVVVATAVAKKTVAAPAPAPVPIIKAAAPAPAGGFFGFLNPSPSTPAAKAAPAEPKVVPAVAAKKVAAPVPAMKAKAVVAVAAPEKKAEAPAGGVFGFLNSSPPKTTAVKAAPAAAAKKPAAVGMNVKFLARISRLLKGDSSKIKAFQTATDSFRSGAVTGDAFLKTLESLFGADALESVVVPLVSELPERDAAAKLLSSFEKKVSMMKKASEPAKAPFSFSFGAPKKVEVPVPVVVAPPPKKEGFSFPFGAPKAAAPAPAQKAAPAVKLPAGVPASKKVAVETQVKQLLSGAIDAKVFYKNVSKDLGRPKTVEIMAELIRALPKPVGLKVDAVFKADK